MENRKRNITLSIRLTAEEKESLKKKAEQANLSMTDYLLRCSSRKKIRVVNMNKVIPNYVIESIARTVLPDIIAFYESEEGRKEYDAWKREQDRINQRDKE